MASGLIAVVLISLLGVVLARRIGQDEAIRDAEDLTRAAAEDAIEPALSDAAVRGDPRALAVLDSVVRKRVLSDSSVVRVKIWDRTGRIVYSDEPRLIGARYPVPPEELQEFEGNRIDAAVSDLSKPENSFERRFGKLLEVYLPVETPTGRQLRYEAYFRSSFVAARARRLFRKFALVMLGALILLALIQLPLAWQLARRVRKSQLEREALLNRAIEASDMERRRIAHDLHDGVVQDLAAVSYSLSAAAERAPAPFDVALREAAAETRNGIRQLRTLLVEIYPPELHRAGLASALADLLTSCEARGIEVNLEVDTEVDLEPEVEALFFRVAQEALRNVTKHADAKRVDVTVTRNDGLATLSVLDDGGGFDPKHDRDGAHFGLRMLADIVRDSGGVLEIDSSPGAGTRVRVEVPV